MIIHYREVFEAGEAMRDSTALMVAQARVGNQASECQTQRFNGSRSAGIMGVWHGVGLRDVVCSDRTRNRRHPDQSDPRRIDAGATEFRDKLVEAVLCLSAV